MKLVAISDTHGQQIKIPPCDILLHCGDISPMEDHSFYHQQQWFHDTFVPWLKTLPAKNIAFIGGNHDFWLWEMCRSSNEGVIHKSLPLNVHYLRDESVTIGGITIHGTPWVPVLDRWAFYAPEGSRIEPLADCDILLTHSPVYGCCDRIEEYQGKEHLGSKDVRNAILRATKMPKYVFCGHIHSGSHEAEQLVVGQPTVVRNVSVLDERYEQKYKPYEFEI